MNLALIDAAASAYEAGASEPDTARLEFFKSLYRIEQSWADRVAVECGYAAPAADRIGELYWSFVPVLSQHPVSTDPALLAGAAADIAGLVADGAGLGDSVVCALRGFDWERFTRSADLGLAGSDPARFIEGCLGGLDALDVSADLPASVFGMALSAALRPFLQPASDAVMAAAPKDQTNHDRPVDCPVCGSFASASFVGQAAGTDGRGRAQYCAQCGAVWEFERIRCGCCGTHSQRRLHYFNVEGDTSHRLQSCDECGNYERVAFQDDIPGPLCMEIEDVVMARLDRIALDPRFRTEAQVYHPNA